MVSPAQKFATEEYKRRHYDFTAIRLPAGQRQRLKEYAYSTGRSMSGLIIQAIRELLERYRVRACYYGHLHGASHRLAVQGERSGVVYRLISADFLKFRPEKILE